MRPSMMELDLCSLPQDCLEVIFSKIEFGRERQLVWALSGSCKITQQAVKDCPAKVRLYGLWTGKQLLGLLSALPNMTSLSMDDAGELYFDRCTAMAEIREFAEFLSQCKLEHLDFRRMYAAFINMNDEIALDNLEGIAHLPVALQRLMMPEHGLPQSLRQQVVSLRVSTCLDCVMRTYWPTLSLIALKELTVTFDWFDYPYFYTENEHLSPTSEASKFFPSNLKQLTNLTRLALGISEQLNDLEPPSSLQELKLYGSAEQLNHLTPSLTSLPLLTRLEFEKPMLDEPFTGKVCRNPPGPLFGHLRSLAVVGLDNFPVIRAPRLTCLNLNGSVERYEDNQLSAEVIEQASTLTSIKYLEISSWQKWDDLKPMAALPLLSHLSTNLRLQLLEGMLDSAGLQNLECVSLNVKYESRQASISGERRAVRLRRRLLALPKLKRLSVCRSDCRDEVEGMKRVLEALGLEGLQEGKWQCVYSQDVSKVYEKNAK